MLYIPKILRIRVRYLFGWGVGCGAVLLGVGVTHAAAAQFWLGGEDPVVQADKGKSDPADFMQLFRPDSPWQRASSRLAVFKISTQFATRGSDADLAAVLTGLRRRGIALALEAGMLRADRGCGRGEGYMPKGLLDRALSRIQRLGGRLDYLAIDEVVFFGREKTWADRPNRIPCQDTVDELAREVGANVAVVNRYFPQAKIGAIEPINSRINLDRLVADYLAFADRFRSETGRSLAFMHADIAWHSRWEPAIAPLRGGLHARGIRFGVIVGGSPDDADSPSWARTGLQRLAILAANPATLPDDVVVQSWQPLPLRMLPETMPGSSTWLLLRAEMLLR